MSADDKLAAAVEWLSEGGGFRAAAWLLALSHAARARSPELAAALLNGSFALVAACVVSRCAARAVDASAAERASRRLAAAGKLLLRVSQLDYSWWRRAAPWVTRAHAAWQLRSALRGASPPRLLRAAALAAGEWHPGLRPLPALLFGWLALYTPLCGVHERGSGSPPALVAGWAPAGLDDPPLPPLTRAGKRAHYGSIWNVTYVGTYDGDTFHCALPGLLAAPSSHGGGAARLFAERLPIRIAGIDAPELRASCAAERALALRAAGRTRGLLSRGRSIALHRVRMDKYFRVLADVEVDGSDLGALLLRERLAVAYDGGTKRANAWGC